MNNTREAVVILILAVAVSGCIDNGQQSEVPELSEEEADGLEIVKFDTTDPNMIPDQRSQVIVELENRHRYPVQVEDISLYNTAFLDAGNKSCVPEGEIQGAQYEEDEEDSHIPSMECRWDVQAPEDSVEGYESRNVPLKMNLEYRSRLENHEGMEIQFKPLEEIDRTEDTSTTYSNNEIELDVFLRQPVRAEEAGGTASFRLNNIGEGRVASDYGFSIEPDRVQEMFGSNCRDAGDGVTKEPVIGEELEFDCEISGEGEERTENVFFSISYKYVKAPTLDIEVVNR